MAALDFSPAPDDELRPWLLLTLTHGVGAESVRRLLAAFGSPQAVLAASSQALREVAGSRCAQALSEATSDETLALVERTLAWRAEAPAVRHLLTLADSIYPPALLQTADPPVLLYAMGQLAQLQQPAIAIVGSRNATPQGLDHARSFAEHFSAAGVTVVSGLALGIDGAAHEGALKATGGTIAVVGTGLDLVYPRRHLALARQVVEQGLMLSEYALGTPSVSANFPRRNRIIAGLASGTLVVEANLRSGSLITARLAMECNREVMAIPGSISSAQSRGCHQLIKDGAALVESPEEVLDLLGWAQGAKPIASLGIAGAHDADESEGAHPQAKEDAVLAAMGHDPVSVDALSARTGWPTDQLLAHLLTLELDGQVARLPGGLLQRRASA